jgi:hypothetical protein
VADRETVDLNGTEDGNPYWHPEVKPHAIDVDEVERLSLECAHLIFASHQAAVMDLDEEGNRQRKSRLARLHLANAEKILSKAMLQIAVSVRTLDDQLCQSGDAQYASHLKAIDDRGPFAISHGDEEAKLSMRQTCNKIIHAQDFRPVYERDDDFGDKPVWYMTSVIELEGEAFGKPWSFTLEALNFLDCVLDFVSYKPT